MIRGPLFWTPGKREYMALFTAQWQRCPFCIETHAELTRMPEMKGRAEALLMTMARRRGVVGELSGPGQQNPRTASKADDAGLLPGISG